MGVDEWVAAEAEIESLTAGELAAEFAPGGAIAEVGLDAGKAEGRPPGALERRR